MPSVLNLLPAAVGQTDDKIFSGTVSKYRSAPSSPTDTLYVDVDWNSSTLVEIVDWPMLHGARLPAQGDSVLIVVDDVRNQRCVWWSGASTTSHAAARAYRLGSFGTQAGWNKITLDTISHDEGENVDLANGRYVVPQSGTYQINGQVELAASAGASAQVAIFSNGTSASHGSGLRAISASTVALVVSDAIRCFAGDLIELWVCTSVPTLLLTQIDPDFDLVNKIGGPLPTGVDVANYLSIEQVLT